VPRDQNGPSHLRGPDRRRRIKVKILNVSCIPNHRFAGMDWRNMPRRTLAGHRPSRHFGRRLGEWLLGQADRRERYPMNPTPSISLTMANCCKLPIEMLNTVILSIPYDIDHYMARIPSNKVAYRMINLILCKERAYCIAIGRRRPGVAMPLAGRAGRTTHLGAPGVAMAAATAPHSPAAALPQPCHSPGRPVPAPRLPTPGEVGVRVRPAIALSRRPLPAMRPCHAPLPCAQGRARANRPSAQ